MSILLTGGAGFIGSCVLRSLNDIGEHDVIVVDDIGESEKWLNLRNKNFNEYIHKDHLPGRLPGLSDVTVVIHMGACSDTTETDFDYLYRENVEYSKMLWKFCSERGIPFIYASSAATYGASALCDDTGDIARLCPLNRYGYSKQLFDLWTQKQMHRPPQAAGLKFFNVFGPNEYHKGSMASVAFHGYRQIRESGTLKLFMSANPSIKDGEQSRDFIYVKDVCKVILFFMQNRDKHGIFNVGTGKSETFNALGSALFSALGLPEQIEYIDMPAHLIGKYQYKTEAAMEKLRDAGYTEKFYTVGDAVSDYAQNYLSRDFTIY